MGKRKSEILIIIILTFICQLLSAGVSEENIKTFDLLWELQKDPDNLEFALDCTLSTMMYADDHFPSQDAAEELLKRIYTKIELSEQYGVEDPIFRAIIKESTKELLDTLQTFDEGTEKYAEAIELLDFVTDDFAELLQNFHFEKFKAYFNLTKLNHMQLLESIDGKQMQTLINHIIETLIENDYYLDSSTYSDIVQLGKEKFLNFLTIQISPFLNQNSIETLEQQYSLLKAYISFYQSYFGKTYKDKIPENPYNYYLELESYYNYLSDVEILSRRLLTAEESTLSNLFPVFVEYLKNLQTIYPKTEKLYNTALKMIKNASTRLSYDNTHLLSQKLDISELSISNEAINASLNNLASILTTHTEEEQEQPKEIILPVLFNNPLFFISIIAVIFLLILFILVLPLKVKGTFYKSLGLSSKALTLFEKAAIKHPMDPDIHIKTAQIYEKMGREEEAMNEYKIASKVLDMKED